MNPDSQQEEVVPTKATERKPDIVFDPVYESRRIRELVREEMEAVGEGNTFDKRIRRERKHMDQLAERLMMLGAIESYADMHTRLRAVERAEWGLEGINRNNQRLYPGFEVDEVTDLATLTELIGVRALYHGVLTTWQNEKQIDSRWVAIDTVDAMCVSSGISALAMKEGVAIGRKVVDLGGGDGTWGFVLASLGFRVTLIERDKRLLEQFEIERSRLKKLGVKIGNVKAVQGEFFLAETKNSPEILKALREADVMVCYPWPEEIEDRLCLYQKFAKPGAVLVMYGGQLDSFVIDSRMLKKYGLEVVGSEIKEELLSRGGDKPRWIRGYNTPSMGANWMMIKRRDKK